MQRQVNCTLHTPLCDIVKQCSRIFKLSFVCWPKKVDAIDCQCNSSTFNHGLDVGDRPVCWCGSLLDIIRAAKLGRWQVRESQPLLFFGLRLARLNHLALIGFSLRCGRGLVNGRTWLTHDGQQTSGDGVRKWQWRGHCGGGHTWHARVMQSEFTSRQSGLWRRHETTGEGHLNVAPLSGGNAAGCCDVMRLDWRRLSLWRLSRPKPSWRRQ